MIKDKIMKITFKRKETEFTIDLNEKVVLSILKKIDKPMIYTGFLVSMFNMDTIENLVLLFI